MKFKEERVKVDEKESLLLFMKIDNYPSRQSRRTRWYEFIKGAGNGRYMVFSAPGFVVEKVNLSIST